MQEVCATCEPVPDALLAKAEAAKHHGKGVQYARQWLYAAFDLAMHGPDAPEPMALWARMEGATPLGHVPGSMFPAGFAHVATNYGAGYYGYLWSEVVAADLRTAFAQGSAGSRGGAALPPRHPGQRLAVQARRTGAAFPLAQQQPTRVLR